MIAPAVLFANSRVRAAVAGRAHGALRWLARDYDGKQGINKAV